MARRVLFVNTPTYVGGAEVSLIELMKHLEPRRYIPCLMTAGEGALAQRARDAQIPMLIQEFAWFSRRRPWRYLACLMQLVQKLRELDVALVHTNCEDGLPYMMRACRWARIPYVSHVRGWFRPTSSAALNRAARVISNSDATTQACLAAGVRRDRLMRIYNPVDLEAFGAPAAGARANLRAEWGVPLKARVVGIVGQIQALKGHAEFVHAGLALCERTPDVHFVVVGAPPPDASDLAFAVNLQATVGASRYANRFHFVGFRKDIPSVMKAIDILAVPSWREPFGRVAVEGMAAGCAVIGTRAGGLPEVIHHLLDGVLVAPNNVPELADAMFSLLTDASLRQRLAHVGVGSAQRFSTRAHVEAVQAVYDQVLRAQG
jgi:glycosyltransferase involved in cell wall biosynthesis